MGHWTSDVETITLGLPQGAGPSPALFNVYTVVGITSKQLEANPAENVKMYCNGRDGQVIKVSAQGALKLLDKW